MMIQSQSTAPSIKYSTNVLERRQRAAAEYLAWADHHAQEVARAKAMQALHGDDQSVEQCSSAAQQKLWARRRMHEKHLHDSALAQLRDR